MPVAEHNVHYMKNNFPIRVDRRTRTKRHSDPDTPTPDGPMPSSDLVESDDRDETDALGVKPVGLLPFSGRRIAGKKRAKEVDGEDAFGMGGPEGAKRRKLDDPADVQIAVRNEDDEDEDEDEDDDEDDDDDDDDEDEDEEEEEDDEDEEEEEEEENDEPEEEEEPIDPKQLLALIISNQTYVTALQSETFTLRRDMYALEEKCSHKVHKAHMDLLTREIKLAREVTKLSGTLRQQIGDLEGRARGEVHRLAMALGAEQVRSAKLEQKVAVREQETRMLLGMVRGVKAEWEGACEGLRREVRGLRREVGELREGGWRTGRE